MRTRQANYPSPSDGITFCLKPVIRKWRQPIMEDTNERPCKVSRVSCVKNKSGGGIESLSDDLLTAIIAFVGSAASSPADLVNAMLTSRRFCAAATHPLVLARVAVPALEVKARSWSEGAHRFLKHCADAGNIEACYTLGMIRFYCLGNRVSGIGLMAKAAVTTHSSALHSLAIIQFNGSGGIRKDKDLKVGVALCKRAAALGHVDAIRELGHCLEDGYGVNKNVFEGRRLLLEANTREAAAAILAAPRSSAHRDLHPTLDSSGLSCQHERTPFPSPSILNKAHLIHRGFLDHAGNFVSVTAYPHHVFRFPATAACSLLSDFGCNIPPPRLHAANKFLVDWFSLHPPPCGLRLCFHGNCGRLETRKHEFRRCSACGSVNYCSRACQALDWKLRHKYNCRPVVEWEARAVQEANLQALM